MAFKYSLPLCISILSGPLALADIQELEDQYFKIYEQILLFESRDHYARQMMALRFLELRPEEQTRFNLEILNLLEPTSTGCKMKEMAEADVSQGNFNVLLFGDTFLPGKLEQRMVIYMKEKYGIWHFPFYQRATSPAQYGDLLELYNKVAEEGILKKFGKSRTSMWWEAKAYVESQDKENSTE